MYVRLSMRDVKNFEIAEKEYATTTIGIRELAKKYKFDRCVFTGWLLAKGYNIYNKRAEKSANVHYFDNIDNEEKSYWLGFLFADGALSTNGKSYNIELGLKLEDVDHVKNFAKAVNKEHIIIDSYRARCIIGSKHMFEVLSNYGCTTKKSLTLTFPNVNIFKDKSLIKDFIRGYVDGDGCLSWGNKKHTKCLVSILGTKNFLNGIINIFPPTCKLRKNNKNQDITLVLTYNGRLGFDFCSYLYKNATVYLKRKYERYTQYCRLYQ